MVIYILGLFQFCSLYLLCVVISEQLGEVDLKLLGAVLATQIPVFVSIFVLHRRITKLTEENTARKPNPRSKSKFLNSLEDIPSSSVSSKSTSILSPNPSPQRENVPSSLAEISNTTSFHVSRKLKRIVPFVSRTLSPVKRDDVERPKSASPAGRKVIEKRLSNKTKRLVQQIKERQKVRCSENSAKSPEPDSNQDKTSEELDNQKIMKPIIETQCSDLLSILSTEEKLVFDKYVKSLL
ncbi:hypothetical protein ACHWQZ_G001677 [Mnemiopsis leidyi]